MAIKVVKPPRESYLITCFVCHAELEYTLEDVEARAIQCPCCKEYNPVSGRSKPVYKKIPDYANVYPGSSSCSSCERDIVICQEEGRCMKNA